MFSWTNVCVVISCCQCSSCAAVCGFPGCGHPRTPDNTTTHGKCRTCGREHQRRYYSDLRRRYPGVGLAQAQAMKMAEAEIARLGIAGVHGDQFDRARHRTEMRLKRAARRKP